MSDRVIEVENLTKRYQLGVISHQSLRRELQSRWARLRGRDDPNSCIAEKVGRHAESKEVLWALEGLTFDVRRGDVVGIVGGNGAGKSTLLKVLSRVTTPTAGMVRLRGHVASLLEVGTGFHPELTGRENIFLNGAILGMRREEIRRKLDEIIGFAEVERFVDTPVKRYSSGMYVRLAFAVAAHLEPEILIVDEVLAVGDIQFQRKCLGKMGTVAASGRTILFVSHNLNAVRSLCSRLLLLERGRLVLDGGVEEGLARYESSFTGMHGTGAGRRFEGPLAGTVRLHGVEIVQAGRACAVQDPSISLSVVLRFEVSRPLRALEIKLSFFKDGLLVASCFDPPAEQPVEAGKLTAKFDFPAGPFLPGRYTLGVGVLASAGEWAWAPDVGALELADRLRIAAHDRSRGVLEIPYSTSRQSSPDARSSGDESEDETSRREIST